MNKSFLIATVVIFFVLSAVFYSMKTYAPEFRFNVLMTGNVIMAVLSVLTYFIVKKTASEKPEAFVRGVYGATFLKLMVCIVSIVLYAILNKKDIHKPSLFVLFGIYAVYTAVETWLLSKMVREIK